MKAKEDLLDSKEKLSEWIKQDRVSCGYSAKSSLKECIYNLFAPNYILRFEKQLRIVEYLSNCKSGLFWRVILLFFRLELRRLELRLGFTIPINVFGPGLSIAHYGTIIVSQDASIGSNCRLHAGVNIGASAGKKGAPHIGDNVYIGPGAILFGSIVIADNISIGANSTVNKSFETKNVVVAGTPARIVRDCVPAWNQHDDQG